MRLLINIIGHSHLSAVIDEVIGTNNDRLPDVIAHSANTGGPGVRLSRHRGQLMIRATENHSKSVFPVTAASHLDSHVPFEVCSRSVSSCAPLYTWRIMICRRCVTRSRPALVVPSESRKDCVRNRQHPGPGSPAPSTPSRTPLWTLSHRQTPRRTAPGSPPPFPDGPPQGTVVPSLQLRGL